mgnify:FL=1
MQSCAPGLLMVMLKSSMQVSKIFWMVQDGSIVVVSQVGAKYLSQCIQLSRAIGERTSVLLIIDLWELDAVHSNHRWILCDFANPLLLDFVRCEQGIRVTLTLSKIDFVPSSLLEHQGLV